MDVKFKIEILSDRLYDHALRKSQNYDHLSAVMKRKSEADHPRTVVADSENSWVFFRSLPSWEHGRAKMDLILNRHN